MHTKKTTKYNKLQFVNTENKIVQGGKYLALLSQTLTKNSNKSTVKTTKLPPSE